MLLLLLSVRASERTNERTNKRALEHTLTALVLLGLFFGCSNSSLEFARSAKLSLACRSSPLESSVCVRACLRGGGARVRLSLASCECSLHRSSMMRTTTMHAACVCALAWCCRHAHRYCARPLSPFLTAFAPLFPTPLCVCEHARATLEPRCACNIRRSTLVLPIDSIGCASLYAS